MNGDVSETVSSNPDDAKWAYFREDLMVHVFHALLHKVVEAYFNDTSFNHELDGRVYQLFFYTHQQFIRRANIEIATNDLPEVKPLNIEDWSKPLGPGVKAGAETIHKTLKDFMYFLGWYRWLDLGGRVDDCDVSQRNPAALQALQSSLDMFRSIADAETDENNVAKAMSSTGYHARGHVTISDECSDCTPCKGLMTASEASGRDPIFYRWHTHVEDLLQNFRDTKLAVYEQSDFLLSDGVEVVNIETVMKKRTTGTERALINILTTHMEVSDVVHHNRVTGSASISYNRLNHLPFMYKIDINNPQQSTKKVIVRIWLGYLPNNDEK